MRVLLALDESTQAMDEAVRIARGTGASLTALFVLDTTWSDYIGHDWLSGSNSRGGYIEYAGEEDLKEAEAIPKLLLARAEGIDVDVKTVAGRVRDEIIKEAQAGAYSVLVMGHPFKRGLAVVRDTAKDILGKLPCSLYLVKTPAQ